ncbi:MAG: ATP-binding cassette domain-containing protein [Alphaproteobacteria bacterium]|nr:ATP-binding cassette domain-containing protein [Alphaproteobacteria bacterium]
MSKAQVTMQNIVLAGGDGILFNQLNLSINQGMKMAIVGRNGCGKSTLLKLISKQIDVDEGTLFHQPGLTYSMLEQVPDLSKYETIFEFITDGMDPDLDYKVYAWLDELKLDSMRDIKSLSGGEARKAALIRSFYTDPDILILDEPTNHLDIESIGWLEKKLTKLRSTIIFVSHDRAFLGNVSNHVFWIDRTRGHMMKKSFTEFGQWQENVLSDEAEIQRKLDKNIEAETIWSKKGIKARRTRDEGRMRALQALRAEKSKYIKQKGGAHAKLASGNASGLMVIEATNISKNLGEGSAEKCLIDNFSIRINRKDRIAIVGPNGVGKSTLLKILIGEMQPDTGKIEHGTNLTKTYISQSRDDLKGVKRVRDVLAPEGGDQIMVHGRPKNIVAYLKDFLFSPEQIRQPINSLSGGEQCRLLFAKAFANPTNLLILDEPTNDLDLETLELLEGLLANYDGTIILISHDRAFLDAVVSSTIFMHGNGKIIEYAGGYSEAQEQINSEIKRQQSAEIKPVEKVKMTEAYQAPPKTEKMSFKESFRLKELDELVPKTEEVITTLTKELEKPGFYEKQPTEFSKLAKKLEHKKSELDKMEEEWIDLLAKQENLAS